MRRRKKSINVINLTDDGIESPYNYLIGLIVSPSVNKIGIKGEYYLTSSSQPDERRYSALFRIKPYSWLTIPILKRAIERGKAEYDMDFICSQEGGVWDDPGTTVYSQINGLIGKLTIGNLRTEVKKSEKNNEKSGFIEFMLSKI